jgi:cysteine desulfurase / selenocysteine lyase
VTVDFVGSHHETHFFREVQRLTQLLDGLKRLPRVKLYAADSTTDYLQVLSCTVDGIAATYVGDVLDGDYDIAVRTGVHCAPSVHEDLGTLENGTILFSIGPFTTEADIGAAVEAMTAIAG